MMKVAMATEKDTTSRQLSYKQNDISLSSCISFTSMS